MFKVVVIEDENLIRKGLIYTFNWSTYNCIVIGEAEDGEEGIEIIREKKPDIIIVDINMPRVNGLELISRIEDKNIQTIILSGYDEFKFAQEAINLGAISYLLKPLNHKDLSEALMKATDNLRKIQLVKNFDKNLVASIDNLNLGISPNNKSYSKPVNKIINYINANYSQKIIMEDLIDLTYLSKTSINTKFKDETGITINNYINATRIKKSIQLLTSDNDTIYNISDRVGFSNYRYFISVFKKYINMTPTEFMDKFYLKKDDN